MAMQNNFSRAALWAALFCILGATVVWLTMIRPASEQKAAAVAAGSREPLIIETRTDKKEFSIEVARSPDQQALGLMFRTVLPDTQGMLFPHEDEREVTMWMRNTFIPLDMLFIRRDGVIHRIEANTVPMSERIIASGAPVAGVLELAGGAAARLGIAPGDTVRHPFFKAAP